MSNEKPPASRGGARGNICIVCIKWSSEPLSQSCMVRNRIVSRTTASPTAPHRQLHTLRSTPLDPGSGDDLFFVDTTGADVCVEPEGSVPSDLSVTRVLVDDEETVDLAKCTNVLTLPLDRHTLKYLPQI